MVRLSMLLIALSLAACASTGGSRNSEKTNEVMITFVTKARANYWREAMENVTPEEREDMMEDGKVMQEYKDAVGRIRLSTVRNMELGLDSRGRLVGLKDILDESNNMFRASEEKANIDPSKLKDLEAERLKKAKEDSTKTKEIIEKENAEREKAAINLLDGIIIPEEED
jgi:hypothetical protein